MTPDRIAAALGEPLPPKEILRGAVAHADALAPGIYERLTRMCAGEVLMPEDEGLLYNGLYVLAAARHKELWPRLVELARAPGDEIDQLFHGMASLELGRLMITAWSGDGEELLHLIEHADMASDAKVALFDTLTWATFHGRIPRLETAAFLERFEREGLADEEDEVWGGWVVCVTTLGYRQLLPALHRVWEYACFGEAEDDYRQARLAALERAGANPSDPAILDEHFLNPIEDPAEGTAWLEDGMSALREAAEAEGLGDPLTALVEEMREQADEDPGFDLGMSPAEMEWLGRFLSSRQAALSTMPFTMADGYMTALALGPNPPEAADVVVQILGEGGEEPEWQGDQRQHVVKLLAQHWQAIRARRAGSSLARPLLVPIDDDDKWEMAAEWAEGFMLGVEQDETAWKRLLDDKRGGPELADIANLAGDIDTPNDTLLTDEEFDMLVERLPRTLQRIGEFWDDPKRGYRLGEPVRVEKIGRNDPCPCGSGQKYKKCCALKPPPVLN